MHLIVMLRAIAQVSRLLFLRYSRDSFFLVLFIILGGNIIPAAILDIVILIVILGLLI